MLHQRPLADRLVALRDEEDIESACVASILPLHRAPLAAIEVGRA